MNLYFPTTPSQYLEDYDEVQAISVLPYILREIKKGRDKSDWYPDIIYFIHSKNFKLKKLVYEFINYYDMPKYIKFIENAVCTDLGSKEKNLMIVALEYIKINHNIHESYILHILNLICHKDYQIRKIAYFAFERLFENTEWIDKYFLGLVTLKIIYKHEYEGLRVAYNIFEKFDVLKHKIWEFLGSASTIESKLLCLLILYKVIAKVLDSDKIKNYENEKECINTEVKHMHNLTSIRTLSEIAHFIYVDKNIKLKRQIRLDETIFKEIKNIFKQLNKNNIETRVLMACRSIVRINKEITQQLLKIISHLVRKKYPICNKLYELIREAIYGIKILKINGAEFIICVCDDFYIKRSELIASSTISNVNLQKKRSKKRRSELHYLCLLICHEKNFMFNDIIEFYSESNFLFSKMFIKCYEYEYRKKAANVLFMELNEKETHQKVHEYISNSTLNFTDLLKKLKQCVINKNFKFFYMLLHIAKISFESFLKVKYRKEDTERFLSEIREINMHKRENCAYKTHNQESIEDEYEMSTICCRKCQEIMTKKSKVYLNRYNFIDLEVNLIAIQRNLYLDVKRVFAPSRCEILQFSILIEKPGLIKIYEVPYNFISKEYIVDFPLYMGTSNINLLKFARATHCTLSEFIIGFNFLTESTYFYIPCIYRREWVCFDEYFVFMIFEVMFFGVYKHDKVILKSTDGLMLKNLHKIKYVKPFLTYKKEFYIFKEYKHSIYFNRFMKNSLIV